MIEEGYLKCFVDGDIKYIRSLNKTEQDKLALFLKYLTKQNIQVVVSTFLVAERSFSDCSAITPEVWSWYMSGRDYETSRCKTIYTKDLSLDINDIIDITGKVEKRFNNYQIVVSKITNLTKESKK